MNKLWLIAVTTYRRQLRSGSFLLITFGLPLLMIVAGAIPVLREVGTSEAHIGYVDESGRLAAVTEVTSDDMALTLTPYSDAAAARAAFDGGEVSGYLVVPAGYFTGERPRFYGAEQPTATLQGALTTFLRQATLPDEPAWAVERLGDISSVTYEALDGGVQLTEGPALIVYVGLPALLAVLFALAVFTGASQLGSVMVKEKQQRSLEMVVTSATPAQLVGGKIGGMTLLSLTQLGIWVAAGAVALTLALSSGSGIGALVIPWRAIVWAALLGVPGYFLYAVLAAGLGIIAGDAQQARQLAGILGFVGMAPLWLAGAVVSTPNAPMLVALTLFPLTSPMFGLLRMAMTDVPIWQLAGGLVCTLAGLAGSIWLVTRIFRATMLMYGQRLRPKQIWRALREA